MFVDKKELKEWKRMMERQLAEKASELKESFLSFYRADFFFLQLTVLFLWKDNSAKLV